MERIKPQSRLIVNTISGKAVQLLNFAAI